MVRMPCWDKARQSDGQCTRSKKSVWYIQIDNPNCSKIFKLLHLLSPNVLQCGVRIEIPCCFSGWAKTWPSEGSCWAPAHCKPPRSGHEVCLYEARSCGAFAAVNGYLGRVHQIIVKFLKFGRESRQKQNVGTLQQTFSHQLIFSLHSFDSHQQIILMPIVVWKHRGSCHHFVASTSKNLFQQIKFANSLAWVCRISVAWGREIAFLPRIPS